MLAQPNFRQQKSGEPFISPQQTLFRISLFRSAKQHFSDSSTWRTVAAIKRDKAISGIKVRKNMSLGLVQRTTGLSGKAKVSKESN